MAYPGSIAKFKEYAPAPIGNDPAKISYVTLFEDSPALTCFALQEASAIPINAAFNKVMENRKKPYVDGITLEDGKKGDTVRAACNHGMKYNVEFQLPFAPDYFLGLDCTLKGVPPSINEGAKWKVRIARWVSAYEFIFSPGEPINLEETFTPSNGEGDNSARVILGERFYPNMPFKYGDDLKARRVTSKDDQAPFISGVTLTDGYTNTVIPVALRISEPYKTTLAFEELGVYYLGQDGSLTKKTPTFEAGDKWYYPVINVVNPLSFALLHQAPILLVDSKLDHITQ